MKVTIVPIVIGALGTVTKGLLKSLEDLEVGRRVETFQTTALLRTARILRRILDTWGDLLSLKLQWGFPRCVMVKASSYSSRAITFTFGQIPLGKVWTPLSSQLWVK